MSLGIIVKVINKRQQFAKIQINKKPIYLNDKKVIPISTGIIVIIMY
jgi:hypothetical protein